MGKDFTETPLMKQYYAMKAKYPGAIMLFRVGDFYETYGEDAVEAGAILGIVVTKRSNGAAKSVDMAGFPYHAIDTYLPKLVRAGKRVAICDQLEDPKLTTKLVKRGVTELVTPGVSMNDNVLNNKENNFLASVHFGKSNVGVAFLDISTGEFLTAEGTFDYVDKLLSNFAPKEVLIETSCRRLFEEKASAKYLTYNIDEWVYNLATATDRLLSHFGTKSLKGFGIQQMQDAIVASGAIMHYLDITQHKNINHITTISRIEEEKYVRLDRFTVRNLELLAPMNNEEGKSLLNIIDHTLSPMGARLMKRWVVFPLKDIQQINNRLDIVDYFFRDVDAREKISECLESVGDLERLNTKASVGRISPREMLSLLTSLKTITPLKKICSATDNSALNLIADQLNPCSLIRDRIERTIAPDAPVLLSKGGIIRKGISQELDELRSISKNGKDYLFKLQNTLIEQTGIPSLKINYNNVFGYYIEVRNTYKDKVPEEWIRKQTLTAAERYITPELKTYEDKILGAEEKILVLEQQIFAQLVNDLTEYNQAILLDAQLIARLDCLLSFTIVSLAKHYVRPTIDNSLDIDITEGRHPVIESQLPLGEEYVSNSLKLSNEDQQIIMITGPNMAGKSALLRQTAIIVLMAQMGCYVPAEAARIGIVDKVFTRVGASDNISQGESTFMVEMNEAASILNNMSQRSLILFDELGRGTSTYDGISIAWAIVEYIHEYRKIHPKTLFATHYHELNEMEKSFKRIANYNVSVKEINGKVVFVRKLVRGGSEHSFGIHVAKLAGMPPNIITRANEVLKQLEEANRQQPSNDVLSKLGKRTKDGGLQLSFFQLDDPLLAELRNQIRGIDIDNLTPIQALNKLHEIRSLLSKK